MSIPSAPSPAPPPAAIDQYQRLIDSIEDYAIFMLDADGMVRSWNRGANIVNGYSTAEILGKHFSVFYPPDLVAQGLPARELKTAAEVGRFEGEGWRLRKDGSRFWANIIIGRMVDAGGRLVGFSKIARDLTERREQELRLRHSEERFRLLVTGVKDYAIFMLDTQGFVATWNTGAEAIKGYSAQAKSSGFRIFSRFYPPDAIKRGLPEEELKGAMMQGRFENEGWRVCKDGSRFWANVIITAVRNADGHLIGFSKITRNLNERREQEEALRQSEERFRLMVDGVTEYAIMMLDEGGLRRPAGTPARSGSRATAARRSWASTSRTSTRPKPSRRMSPGSSCRRRGGTGARPARAGGCARTAASSGRAKSPPRSMMTMAGCTALPKSPRI